MLAVLNFLFLLLAVAEMLAAAGAGIGLSRGGHAYYLRCLHYLILLTVAGARED